EIQATLHRGGIQAKWQSRRCAPQVGMIGRQGQDEPGDVLGRTPVHDVDIERHPRGAVHGRGEPADNDELDTTVGQRANYRLEVSHRRRRCPALRNSWTMSSARTSASIRSSTVRLRFSRSSVRSTSRLYASMTGSGSSGSGARGMRLGYQRPPSAPVARAAGLDVLVQLLGEVEALEDELEGGGDRGRLGGAELDDGATQRGKLAELLHVFVRRHRVWHVEAAAGLEGGHHLLQLGLAEAAAEHVVDGLLDEPAE